MSEQKVIVDYLRISFKVPGYEETLKKLINFPEKDAEPLYSRLNYEHCISFARIVYIHWTTSDNPAPGVNVGCLLELTGQGCRKLEDWLPDLNWFDFLYQWHNWLTEKKTPDGKYYIAHLARLDVACDLHDDDRITIPFICEHLDQRKYVGRFSSVDGPYNFVTHRFDNVYLGAKRKSDRFLRIYDKSYEQGLPDTVKWVRFEFQLQNDCATSFYLNLVECFGDWPACYYGVLNDYVRFTYESRNDTGLTNTSRLTTAKWWSDFLNTLLKLKQLYLPGSDYTADKLRAYVAKNCCSSFKTLTLLNDGDVSEVLDLMDKAKLSKKQIDLLKKRGKVFNEKE